MGKQLAIRTGLSVQARQALAHVASADKLLDRSAACVSRAQEEAERLKVKAEDHYKAAGLIFAAIKEKHDSRVDGAWKKACEGKCGLGWRRVYDLIGFASGGRSVAEHRARNARAKAREREKVHDNSECHAPSPCEADPRIAYRSRVVGFMYEAEGVVDGLLDPPQELFDCDWLAETAERIAAKWRRLSVELGRKARDEKRRQGAIPEGSAAQSGPAAAA
jgi:hypothetical protein